MSIQDFYWEDVKLLVSGESVPFVPVEYNSSKNAFEILIEIKIDDLLKNRKEKGYCINLDNETGKSIIIDGIEFKIGNRIFFDKNEYLVYAVLDNTIILELIAITK
ncbi:hypothetical protein ASG31_08330 [Chryseobacterium sp. Leaf404]|uniref:hypothetical protein n=1 Tax=unclassified Chryseobacterium TaxID=2593645 RepID=UPI0006F38F0C|nr:MULTISPECIES: hypothetical protein [unclassified Chryseobacterium]KQT17408.1 hypothetical protein ASG31_08330 [Chryseobacterium sp. Leaf404]